MKANPYRSWTSKDIVDELGTTKAQIADLSEIEEHLRALLVERGQSEYNGDLFRATVSKSVRETLNMDAVRAKLTPQFIKANTNETEVTTVRVVARIAQSKVA